MEEFKNNLLTIEVEETERYIIVKWLGKSVDKDPTSFLAPLLKDILNKASDKKIVVLDFCKIEFMNSSTISPISKVLELARNGITKLQVLYLKNHNWQELIFSALRVFQTRDKRIEIVGR